MTMATPSETVLPDNGIFLCEESNDFRCSICTVDAVFQDWGNHVANPRHVAMLERFNLFFDKTSKGIACKVCGAELDWEATKTHANWHRVTPWFKPADRYKTFFTNHIVEWEAQFFCYPCDVFFPEWSSAYIHVSDKRHRDLLKEHPAVNDFAFWTATEVPYDILVSEALVSFLASTTVECTICKCSQIGIRNIAEHVRGLQHSSMKMEFMKALRDWKNKKSSQLLDHSQSKKLPERVKPSGSGDCENVPESVCEVFLYTYIVKRSEYEFCCKICDLEFCSRASVDCHVREASHTTALYKYGCENISLKQQDYIYHCTCCDCPVLGIKNVHQHVRGFRHKNSLSAMRNLSEKQQVSTDKNIPIKAKPTTQPESAIKPVSFPWPDNHIEKKNSGELHCRLCDETVLANSNVQEHLTGKIHVFGAKQLSEHITLMKDGDFHCRCCNCMVPGTENLYGHIKGNRHAKSLKDLDAHKEAVTKKNYVEIEIPKQPESVANPRFVPNDASLPNGIEKQKNGEMHCRLCKETISRGSNVQVHLAGKAHLLRAEQLRKNLSFIEGNRYHCRCCDCMVPGVENVYRHINGVMHAKSLNDLEKHEKAASSKNSAEVEAPKQPEEILKSSRESLSYDHIFKLTNITSCCKICDCKDLAPSSVDDHVVDKRHVEALKKFSDEISEKKKDKYYCKSCNCTILGIDNVYTHLHGNRHTSFKNTSSEEQGSGTMKSPGSVEVRKPIQSSKTQSKPHSKNAKHDIPMEEIRCSVCGAFLLSTSDLHSHLANHVGEDFSPREESENINEIKDNCSEAEQKDRNGSAGSQLTTEIEGLEQTELVSHDAKASSNSLRINGRTIIPSKSSFVNLASPESVPADCTTKPERTRRSSSKSSMQRTVQLLNFDNDYIHDMKDKLRDTELGMKLCSMKESEKIYCLVCRKEVAETVLNYCKHLSSADHCEYLEEMEKDHALFELVPGQFSEFDLACQYMEEVSEDVVRCHACDKDVDNIDNTLKDHITDKGHEQTWKKMHVRAKQNFEDIKSRLQCDWYNIHKYWCVPCSENFDSELSFAKHLRSTGHAIVIRKSKNSERGLIYDFCAPCALLWFGFRCIYANHCESPTHKWAARNGNHESQELPAIVKCLLAVLEEYIDDTVKHFNEVSVKERETEETLIQDIEMAVKFKFPDAKAFPFGPRVSGLRSGDSDVEIFLDCGNMYDGKESPEYGILYLTTSVHQCLRKDLQSWDVDTLFTNCGSSVLKARHRPTGLSCKISFENGLAGENIKLIKYFNDIFPPCRKLILFLNQWLILSDLAGPQGISNDMLYWFVIFYLQKESSLPSVASLIAKKSDSHLIAGCKAGVSSDIACNEVVSSSLSMREFLIRFFTFYAKFDYRYDVACPLLGREVKKRAFADTQTLPREMAPYIDYMKNSTDPRPFRIDSVVCFQDPLNLARNLTEAVSKAYLSRFRAYCSKSLDVLCS